MVAGLACFMVEKHVNIPKPFSIGNVTVGYYMKKVICPRILEGDHVILYIPANRSGKAYKLATLAGQKLVN